MDKSLFIGFADHHHNKSAVENRWEVVDDQHSKHIGLDTSLAFSSRVQSTPESDASDNVPYKDETNKKEE